MPFPIVPVIAAGASILGNIINTGAQRRQNQAQRAWEEKMYSVQRQDALADWNRQNEYNLPSAQMQRLKAAGLNPNLVYGNGADVTAQPMRSSDPGSWRPEAPKWDMGGVVNSLMNIYDVQLKEAQTDNLKAQNTNILQDTLLKAAQTISTSAMSDKTAADTDMSKFNLSQAKALQNVTLEKAKAELAKVEADIRYTLNSDERQAALTANTLQKSAEEVLQIRAQRAKTDTERVQVLQQIHNLKQDSRIKQLDIELKEKGIQPNDPLYMRILGRIVNSGVDWNTKGKAVFGFTEQERRTLDSLKVEYGNRYDWKSKKAKGW